MNSEFSVYFICCFNFDADTASVYKNEELIGKYLKMLLEEANLRREDIFITSKLCTFLPLCLF